MVQKDRSAEAFVEAGYGDLEPLLEFRDWLKALREQGDKRMAVRRNGAINLVGDGRLIPGPFTMAARREILDHLLSVQAEVGIELITAKELEAIKTVWAQDLSLDPGRLG